MTLSEGQHRALAKVWRYRWYPPGGEVCAPDEEAALFHIVVGGASRLTERRIHHLEGRTT
jgi:hypothetical protein